jgi:multidrug efflux system membrane fusion protein
VTTPPDKAVETVLAISSDPLADAPPKTIPLVAPNLLLCWRIVLVAVILGAGMYGAKRITDLRQDPKRTAAAHSIPTVDIITAEPHTESIVLQGYGTVGSATIAAIRPRVSGRVVGVYAPMEPGDVVAKGTVLVRLDATDYELSRDVNRADRGRLEAETKRLLTDEVTTTKQLNLAQQGVDLSQREFARLQRLLQEEKVGTTSNLERAERTLLQDRDRLAQLEKVLHAIPHSIASLQAQIERLDRQLAVDDLAISRCTLVAPFNGRVVSVAVERNDVAAPGATLLTLADDDNLEIPVSLDAGDVNRWLRFRQGDEQSRGDWFGLVETVPVRIAWLEDSEQAAWTGKVVRVRKIDERTRTVSVVVRPEFDPGRLAGSYPLIPGMFCSVTIPGKTVADVYRVPRSALGEDDNVFVVVDDVLVERSIHILREVGDELLIDHGLEPGDEVIISRLSAPVEKMKVRVRRRNGEPVQPDAELSNANGADRETPL